jgi:ribokinase
MDKLGSNIKVSFAPGALYAAKGLKNLVPILSKTHVLFINQSEIRQLTGQGVKAGAKTCLKHGCQIVAITLGKGAKLGNAIATSYIRDSSNEYIVEPGLF